MPPSKKWSTNRPGALRRKHRYVRRCRTDRLSGGLDDCNQDRLDDLATTGHGAEAEVFSSRPSTPSGAAHHLYGMADLCSKRSPFPGGVAPALCAADAECAHRNPALRATINVYVRRRGDLTSRKQAQADLAKRRAGS